MRFMQRWLGSQRSTVSPAEGRVAASAQQDRTRHEIAKMAVRDVLKKHGIPTDWVFCEVLAGYTRERIRGMHVRLVVKEWQPALFPYTVSIQRAILARLIRIDPLSPGWFAGLSWRYDVVDDSTCPPLPLSHDWKAKQAGAAKAPSTRDVLEAQLGTAAARRSHENTDFRATEPMQPG